MAGERGSVPGESTFDEVYGYAFREMNFVELSESIDYSQSGEYVNKWNELRSVVLPPTTDDPLFDGRAFTLFNDSRRVEGK